MSTHLTGDEYNLDWSSEDEQVLLNYVDGPPEQHPYTCGWAAGGVLCNEVLFPKQFSAHLKEHGVRGNDKMLCCWVGCHADKMNKESVLRHVFEVHLELRSECPDCGMTFTRKTSLNNHRKREHS